MGRGEPSGYVVVGVVSAVAAGAALAGCRGKATQRRSRDAGPPVVVVGDPSELGTYAREVEPNEDAAAAVALAVPGGVEGSLGQGDVDRFALTMAESGMVALKLRGAAELDAVLEVQDVSGKRVYRSDRGPAGVLEALPDLPLVGGERYVVTVSRFVKKAGKGKAAPAADPSDAPTYKLAVEAVAAPAGGEREPNDDLAAASAAAVVIDEERSGWIGWAKDVDVWGVSLAGFAADAGLDLEVDGVDGVALTVELRAAAGTPAAGAATAGPLVVRRGGKGEGVRVRGVVAAGDLVARLTGAGSNPEMAYRLRTRARTLAADEEREPNDDEASATPVALGAAGGEQGKLRGFLDGGDVDTWRLSASQPIVLSLSTNPLSGVDLTLRAGLVGGRELARSDAGERGVGERLDELAIAPGHDVFVQVSGKAAADLADGYVIEWSWFPGTPSAPSPLEPQPSD